jgi:hypothetical protein
LSLRTGGGRGVSALHYTRKDVEFVTTNIIVQHLVFFLSFLSGERGRGGGMHNVKKKKRNRKGLAADAVSGFSRLCELRHGGPCNLLCQAWGDA